MSRSPPSLHTTPHPHRVHYTKMERYKRKRVMDDDEYDVMLERIVEKTFFPEMQRMRDRRAFMEAVETGDHAEMQRIQAVYTDMTPSRPYDTPATPHAGSATPLPEDLPVQAHPAPTQIIGRQQRQSDDGLPSLDEFLQKVCTVFCGELLLCAHLLIIFCQLFFLHMKR